MTNTVPLTHLSPEEVKAVLSEYRINSADIAFRCDATVFPISVPRANVLQIDDLIDVLEGLNLCNGYLTSR
jgi:developmentally-regulated GTP-binding protein 1